MLKVAVSDTKPSAREYHRFRGGRVLDFNPARQVEWASGHGIEITETETLLENSDILSLHLLLPPGARALIEALKSGRLGGVALGVYEKEGVFFESLSHCVLPDDELSRLLTLPNVLIISHQALAEITGVATENLILN